MGPRRTGLTRLQRNYVMTRKLLRLARSLDRPWMNYEEAGVYQLLISNENTEEIRLFFRDHLGSLLEYDRSNHTHYMEFLRKYMELEFSIQRLAAHEHLHRNSIYYHLNKIKDILNYDVTRWENRLTLELCFCIYDLMQM